MGATRLSPAAFQPGPESQIPDKLYFKIGEVAVLVGVEAHVLRYWEKEVGAIRPGKSASNQRRYRRRDVELFREIRRLLHHDKYTLAGARRRLMGGGPLSSQNAHGNADLEDREPEFAMPDLLSDVLSDPELMLLPQQGPAPESLPPEEAPALEAPPPARAPAAAATPPLARAPTVSAPAMAPASRPAPSVARAALGPRTPSRPSAAPRPAASSRLQAPSGREIAAPAAPPAKSASSGRNERLRQGLRDLIRLAGEQA